MELSAAAADVVAAADTRTMRAKVSGRILLADDNAEMREYVRGLLEGSFAVQTVSDGEVALAVAREGQIDLVLTDVMIPRLDGFQLLRELRKDARTSALPVILLSARTGEESRVQGLGAGADDYMVKPFTARELLARVDAHLRLAKMRREAAALQESEVLFRSTSDCAPILMWTCGLDQRCDYFNARWLEFTGRTALEEVGQGWLENVHPGDREFFLTTFETAFASKLTFQMECRLRRHDGQYRWVLGTGAPRQWHSGQFLGYIVSCLDINDRKEAEDEVTKLNERLERRVAERTAQLALINKDLEAFTASVAHDLRSPIFKVDGYCMVLLEKYGDELKPDALRYLQKVRESARQMNHLVEDLLNLSKIESKDLSRCPTALNALVQVVVTELEAQRSDRDIEWQVTDLPTVDCDPGLMKQVFVNLLDNAVKYTRGRQHALIQVGLMNPDGDRTIYVRDNGAGFNMKSANKLFGAFQRLHRQDEFEGTGIGLATVQRIIQKHKGRIWAEAEEEKGATFYFTLDEVGRHRAAEQQSNVLQN